MQLPPPVHGVSVMNKIIKDSRLINKALDCEYINLATAKDIDDLRKQGVRKYFITLKIALRALYKMATNRYTYVYVTIFPFGFAFYKDSLFVLMARLFGQKPLLHLHTHGFNSNSQRSRLLRAYYRLVFRKSEVICISDQLVSDIEGIYYGKIYILPNGIPQVNFENNYKLRSGPLTLLYLSNLIRGKGIMLILEALKNLKQKGRPVKLRVVGSEGDVSYSELESFVAANDLQKEVELVGPKYGDEKHAEFANADVFLLPSNYDTFGLVLLEAMQFGVPCIASDFGGMPDVIGGGRGVLLPEISAAAVENAIERLLQDPEERMRISRLGFNYFKANFTVEVYEKRYLNILSGQPDRLNERLLQKKL